MKKVNEKKAVKAEKKLFKGEVIPAQKKVSKSETRRSAVQKKPAVKAAKPAKKVVSEDEVAFNKFIDSFDPSITKRCGRLKLFAIYQAGIKRGKSSKKN